MSYSFLHLKWPKSNWSAYTLKHSSKHFDVTPTIVLRRVSGITGSHIFCSVFRNKSMFSFRTCFFFRLASIFHRIAGVFAGLFRRWLMRFCWTIARWLRWRMRSCWYGTCIAFRNRHKVRNVFAWRWRASRTSVSSWHVYLGISAYRAKELPRTVGWHSIAVNEWRWVVVSWLAKSTALRETVHATRVLTANSAIGQANLSEWGTNLSNAVLRNSEL